MLPGGRRTAPFVCIAIALAAMVLSGCGSEDPLPPPSVLLDTNIITTYYPVTGKTSDDIFASIEARGLKDGDTGAKASGLTSYQPSYNWTSRERKGTCSIDEMLISVALEMILPQHTQIESLDTATRKKWDEFASSVAAHEQTHVDIYLQGAEKLKTQMAAITARDTCSVLDEEIKREWATHDRAMNAEQDAFHAREDARVEALLAPLRTRIQQNESQLEALSARIDRLNQNAIALQAELKSLETQLSSIETQLSQLDVVYRGNLPPAVYSRYESLRQQYNATVPRQNTVARQYNTAIADFNAQVDVFNRLIAETETLIETYNWTQ